MTVKRVRWIAAVGLALGLPWLARGEQVVWRAARPAAAPTATLGRPVPLSRPTVVRAVARGQAPDNDPPSPFPPPPPVQAVSATVPPGVGTAPVQPPVPDAPAPVPHTAEQPPSVPPPGSPFPPADVPAPGVVTDRTVGPNFWEKCKGWVKWGDNGSATGRCTLQSDHCFEGLTSPVTMPFYFEDPRSLTELRPIFTYQSIPGSNPLMGGGSAAFFGTQARIAFTERFSVVISELGFLSLQPNNTPPPIQKGTGFAEVKLGPKWTFLRNANSGTVGAVGLNFEIPVGDQKIFQHVGSLSLDPYLSIGQTFGRLPGGYGSFNFLGNIGYSVSTDSVRSDFLYLNLHLDYNLANANTFYPLIEMNWIHYTKAGNNANLGFEGADLINFGSSTRAGDDFFALAVGARYRFNNNIWAGGAVQFPLSRERGLQDYRVTLDMIFRY